MTPQQTDDHTLQSLSDEQLLNLRRTVDAALSERGSRADGPDALAKQLPACRMFTVSEGVRRLDKRQLETLSQSFEAWAKAARDSRTERSRERVLLVFLVLRYTGARLGEALALDERKDFDLERNVVTINSHAGNGEGREVPLPQEVIDRLKSWLEKNPPGPPGTNAGERLFNLDQGFLRRKFYEQEKRSGLSRELLNPRALRNSRAIELLQGGMPMRAVQALLGHTKADFTASYVTLAEGDLKNIIQQYCSKEFGMQSSARNTFVGKVVSIASTPVLCEVVLETDCGHEVAAVITVQSLENLGLAVGKQATARVKATWVSLEKAEGPSPSSSRNAFIGLVKEIACDEVTTEVRGELSDKTPVCALVTNESRERLEVEVGGSYYFIFKAMSVIIS
ncbi:MAG: TOBE domain-containing protein [Desulfovibrionaceae bacterium]